MTAPRTPFDALVDAYDAARPSYPPGLLDALEPLAGRVAVDVGAGTGIATRLLAARGARVLAVDLGPNPLRRLLDRGAPGLLGAVVADAHALPVRDGSADLVTYAQAWHWVRPEDAAREALRALRPGGRLAVWWNNSAAREQPWWSALVALTETANPSFDPRYRDEDTMTRIGEWFGHVERVDVPWTRTLSVDDYVTYLSSKSYVAAAADVPSLLAAARGVLAEAFPGGIVTEPYVTRLWLAQQTV